MPAGGPFFAVRFQWVAQGSPMSRADGDEDATKGPTMCISAPFATAANPQPPRKPAPAGALRLPATCGSSRGADRARLAMNGLDQHVHVVGRRRRQNTVPEIEYVSRRRSRCTHDARYLPANRVRVGQEHKRIEIALQCHPRTDTRARSGEIDGPVQ